MGLRRLTNPAIGEKPAAYRRASVVPDEYLACGPVRLCHGILSRRCIAVRPA